MSIPSFVRPGTAVVYTVSAGNIVSSGSTDTLIALSVSPTAAIVREVLHNTSGTTTVSDHTFVPGWSPDDEGPGGSQVLGSPVLRRSVLRSVTGTWSSEPCQRSVTRWGADRG